MIKFNYILNDIAFDTLVIKCLYEEPTNEDVEECENQIKLLQQENQQLKHILDELEKYLEENKYFYSGYQGEDREEDFSIIGVIDKLKELRGRENE